MAQIFSIRRRWWRRVRHTAWALLLATAAVGAPLCLMGCPTANSAADARPPKASKWFKRAQQEFRVADIDGAHDSVRHALDLVPDDEEVRLLAAQVALARLEFAEVIRLLRGLKSTQALALLGRAYWYDGKLDAAADAFQGMLADPDVVDPWAKAAMSLALQGGGRTPFAVSGGLLAAVDMPRVGPETPLYVVPLEIDGDSALAMVSTGNAEVVLDSATRREPSWVSLRFGKRIEVRDVPALTQDLSGLSKQLGAPIKALLGANLLRHLNVTFDYRGRQFVVRSFEPPPPPVASRVDLYYLRGGGMIMGAGLGASGKPRAALFLDSSSTLPLSLDHGGWQKLGIEATTLPLVPDDPSKKLRTGSIPLLRFGVFELPQVQAYFGAPLDRVEREMKIDVDGVVGAGLLSRFRLTLGDGGRVLWVEQGDSTPASSSPGLAPPTGPPPPTLTPPGMGLQPPSLGMPPGGMTPGQPLGTPRGAPPTEGGR